LWKSLLVAELEKMQPPHIEVYISERLRRQLADIPGYDLDGPITVTDSAPVSVAADWTDGRQTGS
jgi:hypothetical protein